MSGTYSLLITLIPTLLFVLIVLIAIILGIIRGFRKSLILAIQALVAFIICIILFAILANNSQVDTNLVNIVNNFMGQGGLQRQMGVSESSTSVTEILYEFIPKQMDYGDGLALILRENGQYLLQLVLFVYRLILAIICLFIYFLLVLIFYIIYLIFYPERRYKKKIEEGYASLNSEKTYKKRRLYGSLIGLLRGLVGGIVIMAFIGSFFYIAGGTGNKKYNDQLEVNDTSLKEGYQIYEALGSYGTSGIFKVLNTIKVKDNMPFYLYAADLVFSGRINDPERGINVKFNFADEMGAYTTFTRETIDLLMKYGKEDLIKAINANDNIMNTVLKIMDMPEFQEEFNLLIDNFNAKTYFINFSLSLLDSIVAHIDQLKLAETNPDMVETISLMFKKGYLSKYIPEEKEILDQLKTNPNYEYDAKPFITASNLLTKDDAKSLLKFVVAAIELDETKDDTYKIMAFSENLIPSLGELTILNGDRKSEFDDVYERLYFYLDNRYIQTALQQDSGSVEYDRSDVILRGIETEKLEWTTEIRELLNSSANVLGIARSVYDPNKEVFNNVISMFDSTNPNAQINEQKYDAIVNSLKKSELLNKVMSSNGMSAYIRNMLQSSIPTIYVPKVNYMNIKNPDGTETNGEAYNLLVGFKSILKNTNTRALLNDFKKLSSGDTESTNYVRSLLYAMNTTEGGVKPIDTALESSLLRAVFTGAITSNATGSLEIILPDSILEEENGVKVNVIQKEELVNTIDNLLTIMPESGEINQVTLIKEILANKESLVSSAIISASAINMMVNDPKNSLQGVLVIPDEYKAAATKEELRKYSSANIWSSSDELLHLLDGLDKGFGLQESEFDLNDQDAAAELIKANIKKLNDKVSEGSNETKLDVCFKSKIIKASITNHMQGDDVKGLIIPDDAFDDNDTIKVDNVDKKNIYQSEISLLVDIANRLDIDLSKADIENIYLRNNDIPTLVSSKIFRATIDSELKNNNEIIVPLDEETMNNGYISEGELTNLLNILTKYRENILGDADENKKINIKKIQVDNEKIKEFKVSELKELTDSNILQATVINKLATSTDYPISVPNKLKAEADKTYLETKDNFINSNWKKKSEMSNIITALKYMLGEDALISSFSESAIMEKVFDDSFDVDKLFVSIVLNNTISSKLDEKLETLSHEDVRNYTKENINDKYTLKNETDFPEKVYKSEEVDKLLKAIKNLGITSYNDLDDSYDYSNSILNDSVNIDTLYDSIIFWDILTIKVKEQIDSNADIIDHEDAYTNRELSINFYKKQEIASFRNILKDSNTTQMSSFSPKDVKLNDNTKDAVNNSFIIRATVTNNLKNDTNVITPDETYETEKLLYVSDINNLIDALNMIGLDLSNTSINSIIIKKTDVPSLAASKIFRATLGNKLENNNNLVMPQTSPTIDNNYLAEQEMINFLNVLCDNRTKIFGTSDENTPITTNVSIDHNAFSLGELMTFLDSHILHATMVNKIATATNYGISVPTTLSNEASATTLKTIFDTSSCNWTNKNELYQIFDSLAHTFGNNKLIGQIDETLIKGKILEDNFDVEYFAKSIVLNYTLSEKLGEKLNSLANAEVLNYTKEKLYVKYLVTAADFNEDLYKTTEVELLLAGIKALGITNIDNIATQINANTLINNDDVDMDKLYDSIIIWDIVTTKTNETINSNAILKSHAKAFETRNSLTINFFKEIEIVSLRKLMKECNVTDFDSFGMNNLKINDTTLGTIDTSYIIRTTISHYVIEKDVKVPYDSYEFDDVNLVKAQDLKDCLTAIDGSGLDLHTLDVDNLKPTDITDTDSLTNSIILRATISEQVKASGTNKLYTTESEAITDYQNNTLHVLSKAEIMNLIAGIKVFGDSFTITINFAVIASLTIEKQYTLMKSNILAFLVSNILISGFNVGVTVNYNNYVTSTGTITIPDHGTYTLVETSAPGLYKFMPPLIKTNVFNFATKEAVEQASLLTSNDVVAFVIDIKAKYSV